MALSNYLHILISILSKCVNHQYSKIRFSVSCAMFNIWNQIIAQFANIRTIPGALDVRFTRDVCDSDKHKGSDAVMLIAANES
jgi:hypothetical protein